MTTKAWYKPSVQKGQNLQTQEKSLTQNQNASVAYVSILTEFLARRDAITADKFIEPTTEVEDGVDTVVRGEFSDDLKRSYTLLCSFTEQTNVVVTELETALSNLRENTSLAELQKTFTSGVDLADIERRGRRSALLRTMAKDIFWTDVRAAFPELADKPSISLCKGWVPVWNDSGDEMLNLIRKMGATVIRLG